MEEPDYYYVGGITLIFLGCASFLFDSLNIGKIVIFVILNLPVLSKGLLRELVSGFQDL